MNWQTAFISVIGIVNLLLGWFLRIVWDSLRSLQTRFDGLKGELVRQQHHAAETYVRRDDYRADTDEIKTMLRTLLHKIDSKVDK